MTTLDRDSILAIVGRLGDRGVAEIIASGATAEELLEAFVLAQAGETGDPARQPAGLVARLVEILLADSPAPEEER